jgi:hypothetical protein
VITIDTKALAREIATELHRLQQGDVRPSERTHDTVVEFAERMKVSIRLVRKWVALGMPSIRVGRIRRIIIADAQRWLAEGGDKCPAAAAGIAAARRSALRAISGGKNGKPT